MEKIDLHMHSSFSDGTDTPDQLVKKAKASGIGLIALTDHNTLAGIDAFREACHKYDQAGIDGIELSTGWPEQDTAPGTEPPEIHVLGYFPPSSDFSSPAFEPLRRVIREYKVTKIRHNEAIVKKMEDAGIGEGRVTVDGFYAYAHTISDSGNYNRVHIARYLVHLNVVSSISEAMEVYIGKKCPYYVPRKTITVAEAIDAIHAGSGAAVIAHIGEYHFSGTRLQTFFDYCLQNGVDGFELLHPHNTPEDAMQILALADRVLRTSGRTLLLTAGSDFHGAHKLNQQAVPWGIPYSWDVPED